MIGKSALCLVCTINILKTLTISIKVLRRFLVVHSNNQYAEFSREELMLANIDIHPSLKGDVLNIFEVAAFETDFIVILDTASNQISSDLLKLDSFKTNSNKISVLI